MNKTTTLRQALASNSYFSTRMNRSSQLSKRTSLPFAFTLVLTFLLSLVRVGDVWGQVSLYSFSSSSGIYTPISGGSNYNNFTNWSNTNFFDDVSSAALENIGFNFIYNGTAYTQFAVNSNGYITLGALPINSYNPISAGTSNNVISALGGDLIGRGSLLANRTNGSSIITITGGNINQILVGDKVSGSGIPAGATVVSKTTNTVTISANATSTGTGFHFRFSRSTFGIRFQTIGSAPNRTLVIQFTGFQRYTTTSVFGELYNFQIRLNETTNSINFIYDILQPSSTTAVNFEVGLRGSSNTDFNNRTSATDWSSTIGGTSNTSVLALSNSVFPTSGLTYTWTPPPAMTSFSPASVCAGGTITISGTNFSAAVTGVAVNGTAVSSFTVVNATTITAITSNSQTSGAVAISYAGGSSSSGSITVNPLPSISSSGTINAVCSSTSSQTTTLAYTATSNSPISYQLDWNAAANTAGLVDGTLTPFSFVSTGGTINIPVAANVVPGVYSGTLNYTNANGCSGTQAVSLTITPIPTLGGVAQTTPYCYNPVNNSNATITLSGLLNSTAQTATYTIGSGSAQTISFTSSASGTASLSIPVTFANNGQTLTITSINCANFSSNNSVVLNILNSPAAPSVVSTTQTVNVGAQATFTASRTAGTNNALTWWTAPTGGTEIDPDGPSQSVDSVFISYDAVQGASTSIDFCIPNLTTAAASTYKYYVQQFSAVNQCPSPRTEVVVLTNPLVTSSSLSNLLCQTGASVTLTANVTQASSNSTIQWTSNTNSTGSFSNVSTSNPLTANPSISTMYQLNTGVLMPFGCNSTTFNTTLVPPSTTQQNVVVFAPSNLNPIANPSQVCLNGTTTLQPGTPSGNFSVQCINATSAPLNPPSGITATTLCSGGTAAIALTGGSLDDGYWNGRSIGFDFNYFGTTFSTFNIGTNGTINFGSSGSTTFQFPNGFPSTASPLNTIAACARDLQLSSSGGNSAFGTGTLRHWTEGFGNSERCVIQYLDCATWYSTNANDGKNTVQVILYETSGVVEITVFTATNPSATSGTWINDSKNKYIGLQDAIGVSNGATAPNCNSNNVTLTSSYWNGNSNEITTPLAWRFSPPVSYNIQWYLGTGTNLTSLATIPASQGGSTASNYYYQTLSSQAATPGQVNYTVSATNTQTQCPAIAPLSITVNALPAAPNSGGNVTACDNATSTTLTATAPTGCVVNWYSNSNGTGLLLAGSSNYSFTPPSTAGTYTYYAFSVNSSTGCTSATGTAVILTVVAAPAAPVASTLVAPTYCEGSTAVQLGATALSGNTLNWYTGSLSNAPSTVAPTPSTATNTGSPFLYYVTQVSGSNGCESNPTTFTVTVNNTPAAPVYSATVNGTGFTINPQGTISYCQGATTFPIWVNAGPANLLNNPSATQSFWYYTAPTGTAGQTNTSPTPSSSTPGTFTYYVSRRVTATGCEGPRVPVNVIINPSLTPAVAISASTTTVCPGGAITFTATPTNGGPSPTYQWFLNGSAVSGQTSASYSLATPAAGNTVYVTMVSNEPSCLFTPNATSSTVTLNNATVAPSVSIIQSTGTTICQNTPVTFSVQSSLNMGAAPTYSWLLNGVQVGTGATYTTTSLANGNVVSLAMTSNLPSSCLNGSATANSNAITMTVTPATAITAQPANASVCLGGSQSLSVTAVGTGTITYQWQSSTTPTGTFSNISFASNSSSQSATLSVPSVAGQLSYQLLATSSCGSATSSVATISINQATVINTQPQTQTVCEGSPVTFSVGAIGTGTLTYQWRKNGSPITGATAASYTISSLALGDAGAYSVVVTATCGSVTSANAQLTVTPLTTISVQPVGSTVCAGSPVNLSVTAAGTGTLTYQWLQNGTAVSGATSALYTIPTSLVSQSGSYTVVVTGGCSSLTSSAATVVVNTVTAINTQPLSYTGCAFVPTSLTVGAVGTNLTYAWSVGTTAITNATSATYTLANPQTSNSGNYTVVVSGVCGTQTSNIALVTINPLPSPGIINGGVNGICVGATETLTNNVSGGVWTSNNTSIATVNPSTGAVTGVAAGNVTITYTVTNTFGCSNTTTKIVQIKSLPTAVILPPPATQFCIGESMNLQASNAFGYLWSNGATTQTTTVTTSGSYTVTATGNNGCTATSAPLVISVIPAPSVAPITGSSNLCVGSSYNFTSATANGLWTSSNPSVVNVNPNSGLVTASAAGSAVLTYNVANVPGCLNTNPGSATASVTVNTPPVAQITVGGATTFCQGGSVTLTASSGASYLWSNGATTQAITATSSGSYTVTVTNANGCSTTSIAVPVTVNPAPNANIFPGTSVNVCAGSSVTLSTGTAAAYAWSNGATTPTISVNTAGTYTVTLTGSNGCTASSAVTTVALTPLPTANITTSGSTSICQGSSVSLSATAGTGYTYLWSTGATTQTISPTSSGAYSVTVTNNGCSATSAATSVNVIPTPSASITASGPLTFCDGGSVTLSAPSGNGFTYAWSNGSIAQNITSAVSGSFSVTVSNSFGCSSTSSVVAVTVNPLPAISAIAGPSTICMGNSGNFTHAVSGGIYSVANTSVAAVGQSSGAITPVAPGSTLVTYTYSNAFGCSNSVQTNITVNPSPSASATPNGATTFCQGGSVGISAPAALQTTYLWSNGSTQQNINATTSGNYNVVMTNSFGCTSTSNTVAVTVNALPSTTVYPGAAVTICSGNSVTLSTSTAAAYQWSTGANTPTITVNAAGSYTATLTGSNGCTATTAPIVVTVNQTPTATITASGSTSICQGSSVTLTAPVASGYTYLWSNGATTSSITASAAGANTVTVTNNGCSATSAPATITINPVPSAAITASGPLSFCDGGSVTLTAPAGNNFTYLWTNGATSQSVSTTTSGSFGLTVTNAFGCSTVGTPSVVTVNPLPAQTPIIGSTTVCQGTGPILSHAVPGGIYSTSNSSVLNVATLSGNLTPGVIGTAQITYTYSNSFGCSNSVTQTFSVNPSPTASISPLGATTFCQGGSVDIQASAGASSYLWSNGATTPTIAATTSGAYTVLVSNSFGCTATSNVINVNVNPAPNATIYPGTAVNICAGSSVTLSTGTAAAYLWSNGSTSPTITVNAAGNYAVLLTGSNGCTSSSQITAVTVTPVPVASISANGPTAICQGSSVVLTAAPATSYLWNNGATTQSITVSTVGSYFVNVGTGACSATSAPVFVSYNPVPQADITPSGPTTFCQGGQVTLAGPSGNGYTYLWSNGATTQGITTTNPGSFSVTVTNAYGCSATSAVQSVAVNPLPVVTPITGLATLCSNGQTQLANAMTGGIYTSSNLNVASIGNTSGLVSGLGAGTTTISYLYTDNNGCSNTVTYPVTVIAAPVPTIAANGATSFCQGGSVGLQASAGTAYLWSTGATTPSINVNTAGSYSVTVTAANGCSATSAATAVVVNSLPTASILQGAATSFCAGGSAQLSAIPAASYLWSNGSTNQTINVLAPGSYTVTVTGTNGCTATSAPIAVTQTALPTATITASGSTNICQGTSVTLTAAAASSYLWSNGATTQSITVLNPGSYTVQTSNGSCTATSAPTTVSLNPVPSAVITASGPTTFCAGGQVTLAAPTGNNFTYLWSNGSTGATISTSTAGTFSVTVTNSFGCSATSAAQAVVVNALPIVPAITGSNTVCSNGQTLLSNSQSGGVYSISNANLASIGQNSGLLTGLNAGSAVVTYTYTNTNGCTSTATLPVTILAAPTASISANGATSFCQGASLTLNSSAGASYLWNTGATSSSITTTAGGNYFVTVTAANGCATQSQSMTLTVNPLPTVATTSGASTVCSNGTTLLSNATGGGLWSSSNTGLATVNPTTGLVTGVAAGALNINYTVTNTSGCSAVSSKPMTVITPTAATVSASGATTICQGANVTLTASTSSSYLWSTGATTQSITVAQSGPYSVTTVNNGCTAVSTTTTVTVVNPPVASISANGLTALCSGGSVTLTAAPATSYLWSNGATSASITVSAAGSYSVTSTANGCSATSAPTVVTLQATPSAAVTASGSTSFCQGGAVTLTAASAGSYLWSNGANTQSITVSAPGSYTVNVATNGCSATSTPTVVSILPTPTAVITNTGSTTFCAGGSVVLNAPTAPTGSTFTYVWRLNGTPITGATAQTYTANAAGAYSLVVTNNQGCTATSANTTVVVNALPTATITPSGSTTICAGSSVTLSAPAGAAYVWSNGATTQSISATSAGAYTVTVNANGCTATSAATTVVVNALPVATITASGATNLCQGSTVTLTASPATTYLWSNGATTPSITVNTAGNYSVTNTTNGCSVSSNPTTINVQALPVASISVIGNTTFCQGGSVTLTATPASTYLWSNGATTQTIVASVAGNYTVQVSSNGCSATSSAVPVVVNALPSASITAGGPTTFCQGGTVTLTAATAAGYLWSNGATTQSITVNTSGTYGVQQTNALGCAAQAAPVVVSVQSLPATPQIVANGSLALCPGSTVTLSAPTAATYAWSNGATSQSITVTNAGTYGLTVSNAAGCSATAAPIAVTALTAPTATITAAGPTTFCQGGSVVLSAGPASSYLWSNGATSQSITVQNAGTYTVQVAANGCTATSLPTAVVVNTLPVASITANGPTTFCQGGSVVLSAPTAASYLWSTGATTQQITVSNGGQYQLSITTNGCSASAAPVLVSVQALPSVNITPSGALTFCEGGQVTLTADPATTYAWSNGQTTQSITVSQSAALTLTSSNGVCSATSAPININVLAAPALASIAGVSNVCVGTTTALSNATSGGTWTSLAAGIASVDNAGVVTGLSQGATTIQYAYTYANGCSVSTSLPFTVNNIAPVSISANGPLSFCAGASVQLSLPAGLAYNWTNGSTGASIVVNATGSYGATVTNLAGCTYQVSPVQVVANSAPAVSIQSSNPSLCSGQSVTLSSSLAANTYLWNNGAQTNAITVNQPGTYVLTVQDANGCSGSTIYNLATGITPTATIAATGPTSFCSGSNVLLNANNYPGGTYLWSNGATTPSVSANTSGTYAVTITSPSGCTATSNAITLNVLPAPSAAITVSGNTTVCSNQSVSLAVSGTGNYLWTNGLTSQAITPTTSGTYGVTVTGANGCQTTVAPVAITVLPAPTATITANGPTTFCAGGSVTLTANGGASYVWSTNQVGAQLTPTTSGNYTVTATAANGCQDSESMMVTVNPLPANFIVASGPLTFCEGGSVTLSAQAGNTVLWSNSSPTTSIEVSTPGTYSAQVTSPAGCSVSTNALTVVVNAATSSVLNQTALDSYILNGILYTQSGTYVQTTTNAAGCDSTITLNLTLTVGLEEESLVAISVQPNPTDAIFTLKASEALYSTYVIQDAQGKVVATGSLTGTSTTINIDQVARGIYFLKVAEAAEAIRIVKN